MHDLEIHVVPPAIYVSLRSYMPGVFISYPQTYRY